MTESLDRNLELILNRPGHKGIDFFQFEGRSMPNSNGHWKITVFLIDWGNPRGRHQHLIGEGDFQVDEDRRSGDKATCASGGSSKAWLKPVTTN